MDKSRGRSTVQSDIFFLGYILFLLVTGRYPVDSHNRSITNFTMISPETDEIRWKIDETEDSAEPARKHLEKIIIKAATKNINKRFKTVEKFMTALERHIIRFNYNVNLTQENQEEINLKEVKEILFTGSLKNSSKTNTTDKSDNKTNAHTKNSHTKNDNFINKITPDPEIEKYFEKAPKNKDKSNMSLIWHSESHGSRNILDRIDPIWLVGIGIVVLFLIGLFLKI
jgi:hypothetical protein